MPGHLRRQWVEMTTKDFQQTDMSEVIAVLPVAAIEQHGPHLPVEVDAAINRGVVARALELLPPEMPVTFLPAMPVGKSNEHISYPGTLTLSTETLIRLWTEIGESVARAGVRKLVLFNSHGGQPQIADIVARDLRVRRDMFVVTASSYALGR
ncbi:MAG TPA: creatininase family protein, partial [Reyranella sp.]|nr:creatininase family protein [Reyranella sp.]